jgi:LDH2 family malate/lactate/ureidoglycolate dehydrogenase
MKRPAAPALMRASRTIGVSSADAERLCGAALRRAGTPAALARRVARALVRNEQRGLASHGLLRLEEYLADAAAGVIRVAALPSVTAPSPLVRVVDGERGFGVAAADAVADAICDVLADHELAALALVNSNHVGALRDIGESVAARGQIVLGFVNYLGAGQRVLPWNGSRGRLCTNPVLVAIPAGTGPPFVLDMSTSTVAEGRIRARLLARRAVPPGWLVDGDWRTVTDPARLYADPPTAFMTPLGGHKGFGLALAVELLAGVVAGAGHVGAQAAAGGNGGLFLGLRPTLAGRPSAALAADADALRRHTTAPPGRAGGVRWPGQRAQPAPAGATLRVDARVWRAVRLAASGEAEPASEEDW